MRRSLTLERDLIAKYIAPNAPLPLSLPNDIATKVPSFFPSLSLRICVDMRCSLHLCLKPAQSILLEIQRVFGVPATSLSIAHSESLLVSVTSHLFRSRKMRIMATTRSLPGPSSTAPATSPSKPGATSAAAPSHSLALFDAALTSLVTLLS